MSPNTPETLTLKRTDSQDPDFKELIIKLDTDLHARNGDLQEFFNQFNKVDLIKHVVVAYINNTPAGCGAIKHYDTHTTELKRMFVDAHYRGQGIAGKLIAQLETWARELGYTHTILETSKLQHEAVAFIPRMAML